MGKIKVTSTWNKLKNQWDLERESDGLFITELYNCENMQDFFDGLDKDMIYCHELESRLLWITQHDKVYVPSCCEAGTCDLKKSVHHSKGYWREK